MRLNYLQTFVLGLGYFGVLVIWSVYNAFVPLFLKDKFHLLPIWISFFMTLDNIAALVIQPPVGAWSDKLRTRLGRRMPFIIFGVPVAALAFAAIPVAPVLPVFVLCTSTLLISMALWRTPSMALIADVTPSPLRSQASGVVSVIGGIGAVAAYLGGGVVYGINPAYPFWLGAACILVAAALMILLVREPRTAHEVPQEETPGLLASLTELAAARDKSTLTFLGALFCFMGGYAAIESAFTLYATTHLHIEAGKSSLLLGLMSLAFMAAAVPSGNLGIRQSRRTLVRAGLLAMTAIFGAMFLLPPAILTHSLAKLPQVGAFPVLGVLLVLAGAAWALVIVHPLPMLSDMTSPNRIGTYTGIYYLITSAAAIAGPLLNGWLVGVGGGNYNLTILLAAGLQLVGFLLMLGMREKQGKATPENAPV